MANRFGRRRKRALEQKVKDLEEIAYGPFGKCPNHVESIDDLVTVSRSTRINEERGRYEVDVSMEVLMIGPKDCDRVQSMAIGEGCFRLNGRGLRVVGVDVTRGEWLNRSPTATINLKQIRIG